MDIKELKKKKEGDLHRLLAETRDRERELRFKDANKQLKNIREIRTEKKTIAKILTLLNLKKTEKPLKGSSEEVKEEAKK